MELAYKIRINNSISVKIGYTTLMLFMLASSLFVTLKEINTTKIINLISTMIIITTVSFLIISTIYRLYTEVIISEEIVEINNLFKNIKINKKEIIGYQGGLRSYVDPKLKFKNYSYSKYIFTEKTSIFLFIEDNKSSFYYNNADEKRPIDVSENVNNKLIHGLTVKPMLFSRINLYLVAISISIIAGWYLSLNKIKILDSNILLFSGVVLLGFSINRLFLYLYAFILRKTKIILYVDYMKISDRWGSECYSYEEINKANIKILFFTFNKLIKIFIGAYLFNGNQYLTNRVFIT